MISFKFLSMAHKSPSLLPLSLASALLPRVSKLPLVLFYHIFPFFFFLSTLLSLFECPLKLICQSIAFHSSFSSSVLSFGVPLTLPQASSSIHIASVAVIILHHNSFNCNNYLLNSNCVLTHHGEQCFTVK